MLKWQEKNRARIHEAAIEHATSIVKSHSRSKSIKSNSHSHHHKVIPYNVKKMNLRKEIPVHKILELFNFKKYSHLINHHQLMSIIQSQNNQREIEKLISQADEEDREKLLSLIHTLVVMSKDIKKNPLKVTKIKQSHKILPSLHVPKPLPHRQQKDKTVEKFRVRLQNSTNFTPEKNQNRQLAYNRQNYSTKNSSKDDFQFVHESGLHMNEAQNYAVEMIKENSVLSKLVMRLQNIEKQKKEKSEFGKVPYLNMKGIKEMYQSFESGSLSSSIFEIDFKYLLEGLSFRLKEVCSLKLIPSNDQERNQLMKSFLRESLLNEYQEPPRKSTQIHEERPATNPQEISNRDPIQVQDVKNFIQLLFMELKLPKSSLISSYILGNKCEDEINVKDWKILIMAIVCSTVAMNQQLIDQCSKERCQLLENEDCQILIKSLRKKYKEIGKLELARGYFELRSLSKELEQMDSKYSQVSTHNQRVRLDEILKLQNNVVREKKSRFLKKTSNKSF